MLEESNRKETTRVGPNSQVQALWRQRPLATSLLRMPNPLLSKCQVPWQSRFLFASFFGCLNGYGERFGETSHKQTMEMMDILGKMVWKWCKNGTLQEHVSCRFFFFDFACCRGAVRSLAVKLMLLNSRSPNDI